MVKSNFDVKVGGFIKCFLRVLIFGCLGLNYEFFF